MNSIKILDCTLRDGGRIIDCKFSDTDIKNISSRLAHASIDIIELGFLRDSNIIKYCGNSTFFTDVKQLAPFVKNGTKKTMYVAFIDWGMFDFNSLSDCDGSSITGIRVGFTKKNLEQQKDEIIQSLITVKLKGYKLFVQGVNTLNYSDSEMLNLIGMINNIQPYAFGIVDTYGAMYIDDVRRIYKLVDHNLNKDISIDFHSHNNFQLSYSFAQEIISLSRTGTREIIIDATLNGMGKCAGNLNTELIVDYMVRKLHCKYDYDVILDIIDEYIYPIKENNSWGYSIPAMMAGIYQSHPNNVIYLTEKFRLDTKDIKYILSMINPDLRQRYDYDNIRLLYKKYNHTKVNDKASLKKIKSLLSGKKILIILPGKTIDNHKERINDFIIKHEPFIITVNFITQFGNKENRLAFFGSEKRYKRSAAIAFEKNVVVVSNIKHYDEKSIVVNYTGLIEDGNEDFDNSMIMLLNLLHKITIEQFVIAGFDGYKNYESNYSKNNIPEDSRFKQRYDSINSNIADMLKMYRRKLINPNISFLTPSIFEDIFTGY